MVIHSQQAERTWITVCYLVINCVVRKWKTFLRMVRMEISFLFFLQSFPVFWNRKVTLTITGMKKTIIDIYPGSSTHPKVVFREVLHPIELEFGNVDFWGEGKTGEPGGKPPEKSKDPTTNLAHSWPETGQRWWEASAITTTPSLLLNMVWFGFRYQSINRSVPTPFYVFCHGLSIYQFFLGRAGLICSWKLGNLSLLNCLQFSLSRFRTNPL